MSWKEKFKSFFSRNKDSISTGSASGERLKPESDRAMELEVLRPRLTIFAPGNRDDAVEGVLKAAAGHFREEVSVRLFTVEKSKLIRYKLNRENVFEVDENFDSERGNFKRRASLAGREYIEVIGHGSMGDAGFSGKSSGYDEKDMITPDHLKPFFRAIDFANKEVKISLKSCQSGQSTKASRSALMQYHEAAITNMSKAQTIQTEGFLGFIGGNASYATKGDKLTRITKDEKVVHAGKSGFKLAVNNFLRSKDSFNNEKWQTKIIRDPHASSNEEIQRYMLESTRRGKSPNPFVRSVVDL